MSLRTRLFSILLAMTALLAAGEFWLIHTFSKDLRRELAETATTVSQRVVQVFALRTEKTIATPGPSTGGEPAPELTLVQEDIQRIEASPEGEIQLPSTRIQVVAETGADGKPEIRFLGPGEADPPLAHGDRKVWVTRHDVLGPVTRDLATPPPVPIPTEGLDRAVERFARRFLAATLVLLGLGLALAAVVAHRVTAPLGQLVAAAERLGQGDLGTRVTSTAGGEVGRALGAFNAMSDRLRELDADARALRAREHLSELGEVGRGFAHSLRNPLHALGLAVDELARTAPAAETGAARELAGRARRQIRRIDEALRAFLALGTDGGRASTTAVDLAAVARDVALELAQSRPEGKETVRVEVAAEGPALVLGVEAELRAALQALVVNAVEASPAGALVQVRVESRGESGARIEVEDQGPGLPPEVRGRLFTPHVTTKPAGAGMGLYLAQRIAATRYGGRLELSDRPAGGTRAALDLAGRTSSAAPGGDRG